tara:strand:- start:163 stop:369 length:207 start_codon:yes stop_codon:yes gene_type:complete
MFSRGKMFLSRLFYHYLLNIWRINMKPALDVIKGLVEKYPNDQQLGEAVRHFVRELQTIRRKREENDT